VTCRPARASPRCELLGVGPGKVGGQRLVGRAARGCANDQPRRVARQRVHPDDHERLRRLTTDLSRRSTLAENGLCAYQRSGADGPTQRTPRLRLGVLDALDQRVASVTPSPGMSAVNCESAAGQAPYSPMTFSDDALGLTHNAPRSPRAITNPACTR